MQVGRAALDRVQQHLVDETHHGRVVGVLAADGILLGVVDRLDVQAVEVGIAHAFQARTCGFEELLDGVAEFIVLHQDGFGGQAGAELDVIDGLVISRVGDAHEQFVAASPQRQGMVLAHQFFADQAGGLGFFVQAVEVQQGDAEMLRGDFRDLTALDQFVLHQVADQGMRLR